MAHLFWDRINISAYRKPIWTGTITSNFFKNECRDGNSPWHYSL